MTIDRVLHYVDVEPDFCAIYWRRSKSKSRELSFVTIPERAADGSRVWVLHTCTSDGEPECPIKDELQPLYQFELSTIRLNLLNEEPLLAEFCGWARARSAVESVQ